MNEQNLKGDIESKSELTSADQIYLNWIMRKHNQSLEFAQQLVDCCAVEFRKQSNLTDDKRAKIYKKHREALSQKCVASLRRHAKIRCNS